MDPENQKFEKMKKNTWKYYHFTNVYHKFQPYDARFLRYGVQHTEFFVILNHFFALFTHWQTEKSKFWKTEKSNWRYHHFTQVYQKS